jgi:hypothetical protein
MMLRYRTLRQYPNIFVKLTGIESAEFENLLAQIAPMYDEAEYQRLNRADRRRAIGGGDHSELELRDRLLLTLIWLNVYPKQEILGQFFGISQPTVWRCTQRMIPLLAAVGYVPAQEVNHHRRDLTELLETVPDLITIISTYLDKPGGTNSTDKRLAGD